MDDRLHRTDLFRRFRYVQRMTLEFIDRADDLSSAIVLVFLPDSPVQARWATDDDKTKFVERVRQNDQGIKQSQWRQEQAWEAARDPLTYLLFIMYLTQSTIVGGLNTFNSLLINKAFDFSVRNLHQDQPVLTFLRS